MYRTPMVKRAVWLSITPEPEWELPAAVATLRSGAAAPDGEVAAETGRITRLIMRSGQRQWLRYLHGVLVLTESRAASPDPVVRRAAWRAAAGLSNHPHLLLAPPGTGPPRPAANAAGLADAPTKLTTERPDRMTTAQAGDSLTDDQRELRDRARRFVEDVLMPLEIPAELALGRLPLETIDEIKREAIAARMHGGRIDVERGGQGGSMLEWFSVNEQFGRCTNGLDWWVPNVYNVWADATQ